MKKVNIENLSPVVERKYFEDFAEDFNTCSFPSKKFYNIALYNAKKNRKILNKAK